ncbi:MAG: ubiquinone biosynthesis hydroxylase [Rhizobiaceae bacterium]|nr:ubiquinone biosynthesis hydroxylase [Rhizobiaceae bacterium]
MTKGKQKIPDHSDILIAGGGYVGLSCATAIKASAPHLSVMVVDPASDSQIENDERSSAVAADASRMLEALGLWTELLVNAQPINEMIVTDSKVTDITRPVFLTFANDRQGDEPFAHMVENRQLVKALRKKSDALGVIRIEQESVSDFTEASAMCSVNLASGNSVSTRLLIACDGVRSKLRDRAGIKTVHWPYDQKAIVCTVEHERDHAGKAEEHFLPAGPFAILPLKGNRSSLVWTESTRDAENLLKQDEFVFEMELEQRFGHKLGKISVASKVQAFPLGLRLAREFVKNRFALAGDAAHGIHPIAGQGLNLGFKDAAALAETIVNADRLGQDFGTLDVLEQYQAWRRFDTVRMGVTTDVLNRLFSNDNDLLRGLRDVGMGMVDRMPGLKRFFINQAAGDNPASPKLLRGEAI